jgi:hypothetical protein
MNAEIQKEWGRQGRGKEEKIKEKRKKENRNESGIRREVSEKEEGSKGSRNIWFYWT